MKLAVAAALVAVVALSVLIPLGHSPAAPAAPEPATMCARGDTGNATANGSVGVIVGPSPIAGGWCR